MRCSVYNYVWVVLMLVLVVWMLIVNGLIVDW